MFVVELASGDIELVSAADDEERGTLGSFAPSISGDGRFVAFETFAPNFVGLSAASGGPPAGSGSFIGAGADYVVLRDREAKSTTLVSHDLEGKAPNGGSGRAIVSIDGDTVGFVSRQMDLTGASQLSFGSYVFYRWDRASGELNRADVPLPPGAADARMSVALEASSPALAHDGASVAFYSSVRVVGGSPSQPDETFRSLYVWRDDRVRSLDVSGLEPVTTQNYAGITFVGGTELVVQVNNAPTGATPAIVETRLVVCNLNSGACSSIASAQGADLWAPVASSDGTAIAGIRFGRSQGEPNLIVVFAR